MWFGVSVWRIRTPLLVAISLILIGGFASAESPPEPRQRPDGDYLKVVRQDLRGLDLVFRVPQSAIQIEQLGNGRSFVSITGLSPLLEAGSPDLPVFVRSFALPEGAIPVVSVVSGERQIRLGGRVRSIEQSVEGDRVRQLAAPEPGVTQWPAQRVTLEVARFRGLRIARVLIRPAIYDPASDELSIVRDLDIRIDFEGAIGFPRDVLDPATGAGHRLAPNLINLRTIVENRTIVAETTTMPLRPSTTPVFRAGRQDRRPRCGLASTDEPTRLANSTIKFNSESTEPSWGKHRGPGERITLAKSRLTTP